MESLLLLQNLSGSEKDALIWRLWEENQALKAKLGKQGDPTKTSLNSSVSPSRDPKKSEAPVKERHVGGYRRGSLGRKGGGRPLAENPDQTVSLKPCHCAHCNAAFADIHLHSRYDKIDIPPIKPIVTRVDRYVGHCPHCHENTLAPTPEGLEEGSPFSPQIVALALYLRTVHAISYQRLSRLFSHLFGLQISEGALNAGFQRVSSQFEDHANVILARLQRSRLVCSDETTVRVHGRNHWNWVFQNEDVVLHVIRDTRAASVVDEVMGGHRPQFWVSDLYAGQKGHADKWQVCLAHQLRDCQYAIDAGDMIFAPRMKALFLRTCVLARRRKALAESTRQRWRTKLNHELNNVMALAPANKHGQRLRKRYGECHASLFTFLENPDVPPDNNSSERELRPTATYRKVTGSFRSDWGPKLFADVRSAIGTAARKGANAFHAIVAIVQGKPDEQPG
jgi:transposase